MADNPWDLSQEPTARLTVNPLQVRPPTDDIEPGNGGAKPLPTTSPYDEPPNANDFNPWDRAAQRVRESNVGKLPTPELDWTAVGHEFKKGASDAATSALKSWYETTEGRYYPPNAKFVDDADNFYDENHQPIPKQKKPIIAPIARDPVTGETQGAIPGGLDVWNTLGSPASAGKAALGAGPRIPGMGHNQGPPMPPGGGVPPPPLTAGAPILPRPRQIVRGHDDSPPFSWHDLYTQTIDNLHPLKILESEIAKHGALSADEQGYQLARLTRGSYGRSQQAIDNATFDFHTLKNNGMPLKQVLKPVRNNLDDFEDYAVAMRDIEKHNQGITTGADIPQAMGRIAAAPPEYRKALKDLHGYQDRILQYLGDSGMVSADGLKAIRAVNREYVPFNRLMDSDIMSSSKNIQAWNPLNRMKGSEKDILSPLETIVRNTHTLIDIAEKNRALNAFVDAAEKRGITGLIDKVKPPTHPIQVQMEEIERFLKDNGIPVPKGLANAPDSFTIFRPNAFNPAHDEIKVWKNGKPSLYKVDPEVAKAVNGMGRQEVDMVMNAISIPARTLRAGAVLAPEFLIRNLTRDQFAAAVLSKNTYIPYIDYLRGVGHMFAKSEKYQDWLKSGGANSNLVTLERKYIRDQIQSMRDSGWYQKLLDHTVKSPLKLLEKASEYSEQPTRIAEFVKSQKSGKSIHESGFDAREVTTDFGRYGASKWMQMTSRGTAFFNPTIQGNDRFLRALADPATRNATLFKAFSYVTLPTLAFYAVNRQDPRMRDIPRQERDTFWHYPTNDWQPVSKDDLAKAGIGFDNYPGWIKTDKNGQTYVNQGTIHKMAKPFEIGTIFGSGVERSLDTYFGKYPDAFRGFQKSVASAFLPPLMGQMVKPPIEAWTNHNFFREAPLVGQRVRSPAARQYEYTPFTSETAKIVGSVINQVTPEWTHGHMSSPIVLENYITGWFGSLGRDTLKILDAAIEKGAQVGAVVGGTGRKPKVSPEWSEADIPLWRALVTRMPSTGAQSVRDFYENVENSKTITALMKRVANGSEFDNDTQRNSTRDEIRANDPPVKAIAKRAIAVGRMFRAIEMINGSRDMTPKEKRQVIDLLSINIMYATSTANDMFRKAQEEARKEAQKGKQ